MKLQSLPFFKTVTLGSPSARLPGISFGTFVELFRNNWQKLALVGLFALGLFLGARSVAGAPSGWQLRITELLRTQRLNRAQNSILGNAIGYLGGDLLFLIAAYLLGLCAGGLPLLLMLPVLRGLGIGVTSGWLYITYGPTGVGYSLLVLYPATVVSILIMLTGCKESMLMSSDMLLMLNGKLERVESSLRLYTTRYFVLALTSILAAALDAACFSVFSGVFEL